MTIMIRRFIIAVLSGLALAGCSPSVVSFIYEESAPLGQDEEVVVIPMYETMQENLVKVGFVRIGDTGFTSVRNGDYDHVIELAKKEARVLGGNVVRITRHTLPDETCTTHRIEADIYYAPDLLALNPDIPNDFFLTDHPDYAVINIYRLYDFGGVYNVYLGDEMVYKASYLSKTRIKVYNSGDTTLWAKTESKTTLTIPVELGREYYVRCESSEGILLMKPALRLVADEAGWEEFNSVDELKTKIYDTSI